MMSAAQKTICLSIAEKINTVQPIHVNPIKDIDILITELPPSDPMFEPYKAAGIVVY